MRLLFPVTHWITRLKPLREGKPTQSAGSLRPEAGSGIGEHKIAAAEGSDDKRFRQTALADLARRQADRHKGDHAVLLAQVVCATRISVHSAVTFQAVGQDGLADAGLCECPRRTRQQGYSLDLPRTRGNEGKTTQQHVVWLLWRPACEYDVSMLLAAGWTPARGEPGLQQYHPIFRDAVHRGLKGAGG